MNIHPVFPELLAQVTSTGEEPSPGVIIGFLIFLGFLILVLTRGNPRSQPEVVESRTPDRWTDSPVYAENRHKAAAAAIAVHLNTPGESPR